MMGVTALGVGVGVEVGVGVGLGVRVVEAWFLTGVTAPARRQSRPGGFSEVAQGD